MAEIVSSRPLRADQIKSLNSALLISVPPTPQDLQPAPSAGPFHDTISVPPILPNPPPTNSIIAPSISPILPHRSTKSSADAAIHPKKPHEDSNDNQDSKNRSGSDTANAQSAKDDHLHQKENGPKNPSEQRPEDNANMNKSKQKDPPYESRRESVEKTPPMKETELKALPKKAADPSSTVSGASTSEPAPASTKPTALKRRLENAEEAPTTKKQKGADGMPLGAAVKADAELDAMMMTFSVMVKAFTDYRKEINAQRHSTVSRVSEVKGGVDLIEKEISEQKSPTAAEESLMADITTLDSLKKSSLDALEKGPHLKPSLQPGITALEKDIHARRAALQEMVDSRGARRTEAEARLSAARGEINHLEQDLNEESGCFHLEQVKLTTFLVFVEGQLKNMHQKFLREVANLHRKESEDLAEDDMDIDEKQSHDL